MTAATAFGYGDLSFSWGNHISAIFDDHVQQMALMGSFIATGLRAAQRCLWVAPPPSSAALRKALTGLGADLPTLEASGQLLILPEVEFYLQEGLFEPNRIIELISTLLHDGQRAGYPTMRIASDVSWLRAERLSADLWESFEGQLTQQVSALPVVMVCQYDRRQVSGDIIVAAFRTHPIVILGDTIRQNPFYLPTLAGPPEPRDVV